MAASCFFTGVRASLISVSTRRGLCIPRLTYPVENFRVNYYGTSSTPVGSDGTVLKYDIVVVGGGIVGIAAARELLKQHPHYKMCILEKENYLAAHQSGHNSGVIHAGVYYVPGSLRAKLCVEGSELAYKYFDKNSIPYHKCGKLIVATDKEECVRLKVLHERGIANKVKDLQFIDNPKGIKEIEPYCQGMQALFCPHTGIVDWQGAAISMACDFKKRGGCIYKKFKVTSFRESKDLPGGSSDYPVTVSSDTKSVCARFVLTCGGLQSDELAVMSGCKREPRIVPFRGEYLILNPEKRHLVKGNIYPVPDPRYPFLGVHFTPRMDGTMWLGPNAVLAFRREGYTWGDYDMRELWDVLKFSGFRKLAFKNASYGISEMMKSMFMSRQLKDLQKYIPELTIKDISRGPAGVRAQAMNNKGVLVDDFVFDNGDGLLGKRVLHCRNAPSPGATSSLAIARVIADRVKADMHGQQ